jgi:hypothetical protein
MLALFDSNFSLCKYLENRETNESFYDTELLRRAKLGLHSLAFFGLAEFQDLSRDLFELTFYNKLTFKNKTWFLEWHMKDLVALKRDLHRVLSISTAEKITWLNQLDIELYRYAVKIFNKRVKHFNLG